MKMEKAVELALSLSDDQRRQIDEFATKNEIPDPGDPAGVTQTAPSPDSVRTGLDHLGSHLAELNSWHDSFSAELERVLTSEQYTLYLESLLPPPSVDAIDDIERAAVNSQAQSDWYYSWQLQMMVEYHAYYFYAYSYLTFLNSSYELTYITFTFGYACYLNSYNARLYTGYAYTYYPDSTYEYWALWYSKHSGAYAYMARELAALTDGWVWTFNSWNSYQQAMYAYYYHGVALDYITGVTGGPSVRDNTIYLPMVLKGDGSSFGQTSPGGNFGSQGIGKLVIPSRQDVLSRNPIALRAAENASGPDSLSAAERKALDTGNFSMAAAHYSP